MTARKNDTALAAALAVPHLALLPPPTTADGALALLVHALLVHHGFRAAQTAPPAAGDGAAPAAVLPTDWGVGGWGGRYKHTRSAREYEIRSVRLGGVLSVVGVAVGEEATPARVEFTIDECVVAEAVPRLAAEAEEKKGAAGAAEGGRGAAAEAKGGGGGSTGDAAAPARENDGGAWNAVLRNVADVAARLATGVVYVLIPDAAKDGYEHPRAAPGAASYTRNGGGAGGSRHRGARPRRARRSRWATASALGSLSSA